jgi:hypothetical protein
MSITSRNTHPIDLKFEDSNVYEEQSPLPQQTNADRLAIRTATARKSGKKRQETDRVAFPSVVQ